MKIRALALYAIGAMLIAVVGVCAELFYSQQLLNGISTRLNQVYQLTRGAGELQVVAQDFLAHAEARPVAQWQARYRGLDALLGQFDGLDPQAANLLAGIRGDLRDSNEAFMRLAELQAAAFEQLGASDLLLARRDIQRSRLSVGLQGVLDQAARLRASMVKSDMTARRDAAYRLLALLATLTMVVLGSGTVIMRRMAIPIQRLQEGARIIGSGNLDHRVGTAAQDEIGELSRDIDRMSEQLKAVTASRDELERETHERIQAQTRMRYLAEHDTLTGLPNRALMEDRLDRAVAVGARSGNKVGLLFIDLDRFKTINDTLGHLVGDQVLQTLANRFKHCLREMDTLSRLGGDEFVVLLPDIDRGAAVDEVAHKLIAAMAEPFVAGGHEFDLTISIGACLFPEHGGGRDELMRTADVAMYVAKASGRNSYALYTPEMSARAEQRSQMESQLRRALKFGEFVLHYQPQLDVRRGRVVGLEALLRWSRDGQPMRPSAFIPVAEECGLIGAIGSWALWEACEQSRRWQSSGLPALPISVNVSAMQLAKGGLVEDVFAALDSARIAPLAIKLELTESIMMGGAVEVLDQLCALHDKGVGLAIDDFGTGYSSLSYLKRFPIDTLKIDQAFVRELPGDTDDAAIAEAIIRIGQSLDLNVIAEGVETRAQLEFLRAKECSEIQGNLFCAPLPAAMLEPFLRQHFEAAAAV